MAKAEIRPGNCGFTTIVQATAEGRRCTLSIHSDCAAIQRLARELTEVDPFEEISLRKGVPQSLQMGMKHCTHAACPVPVGIIRAVEVEMGLALPIEMTIRLEKTPKP